MIFIDIETTGLDPDRHEVVEIAWADGADGDVYELLVPHTLMGADPSALYLNQYNLRELWDRSAWCLPEDLTELRNALTGQNLAGANPRFDASFLSRLLRSEPWHYRMIDVCQQYAGVTDGQAHGLAEVVLALGELGHNLRQPDHSAAADVRACQDVWKALRTLTAGPVSLGNRGHATS